MHVENQEPPEDGSQNDPHPKLGASVYRSSKSLETDPEETSFNWRSEKRAHEVSQSYRIPPVPILNDNKTQVTNIKHLQQNNLIFIAWLVISSNWLEKIIKEKILGYRDISEVFVFFCVSGDIWR